MSNEFQDAVSRLDELCSHKETQDLQLMKLKCEIREQKNIVNKLKREKAKMDYVDEPIDLPVKVQKSKAPKIKKVGAVKN
jgi:hypothetical protein